MSNSKEIADMSREAESPLWMTLEEALNSGLTRVPKPTYSDVGFGPYGKRNLLDFWKADAHTPTPVLVSIHGGGFQAGDKKVEFEPLLKMCLREKISVAALTYRFSAEAIAPAAFLDAARGIQFIRAQAKNWNIDKSRIAATGVSAGGGISLWLGFHDDLADPSNVDPILRESTKLSAMLVIDAQTSYDPRVIRNLIPGDAYRHPALSQLFGILDLADPDAQPICKRELFEMISPVRHVSKDSPPAMLLYGGSMNPESAKYDIAAGIHHPLFGKMLEEKMKSLGVPCFLCANESVDADPKMGSLRVNTAEIIAFLKQNLKTPANLRPASREGANNIKIG
ncbi:MAG: alpha/beta hydrolase [Spirochaetia bacterium]|nr:alpha/beta hydrolase [Spirochaetia bacterium]